MESTDILSLLIKDIERFKILNKDKFNIYWIIFRYIITSTSFRAIFFYRV
jgi:hypothetical protein